MKAFKITNARPSAGPILQTSNTFRYPGTTSSISANATSNGMVWALENTAPAVVRVAALAFWFISVLTFNAEKAAHEQGAAFFPASTAPTY